MPSINQDEVEWIVWHCSASPKGSNYTRKQCYADHRARGFSDIGYHGFIQEDGAFLFGRPFVDAGRGKIQVPWGAHAKGWNDRSVGICLAGGYAENGTPGSGKWNEVFHAEQRRTMKRVARFFELLFPHARHCGHRDLSPDLDGDGEIMPNEWMKLCPAVDIRKELKLEPLSAIAK
jgi:N-acetylmuramoyl-L-alanine amidase